MKGLDFETKFLFSLCKTWMSIFEISVRKRFGCIELHFTVFELAGDCHLDLPAFFNVPCPALGICGWNDGDGRVLCTGAGFQLAGKAGMSRFIAFAGGGLVGLGLLYLSRTLWMLWLLHLIVLISGAENIPPG